VTVTRRPIDLATFVGPRRAGSRQAILPDHTLRFAWAGQAGFFFDSGRSRSAIDLYLSDSLAVKYEGATYPHRRMMPVPVPPGQVRDLDLLLSTHGHTDHMDPGTIGPVLEASPAAVFACPTSEREKAVARGADPERLVGLVAGKTWRHSADLTVTAIPSAHEGLETDAAGHHRYLGYIIEAGEWRIYHSGDCVPYGELSSALRAFGIDLAIMPVNGRDADRLSRGVPGNFTPEECLQICREADIPHLVACHFDLFSFNTIDRGALTGYLQEFAPNAGVEYTVPEIGMAYDMAVSH